MENVSRELRCFINSSTRYESVILFEELLKVSRVCSSSFSIKHGKGNELQLLVLTQESTTDVWEGHCTEEPRRSKNCTSRDLQDQMTI